MLSIGSELVQLNKQREALRLKLVNLKRKTKFVTEVMTKYKKQMPKYNESSVKVFQKAADEVHKFRYN